jgi:hypothetical protein
MLIPEEYAIVAIKLFATDIIMFKKLYVNLINYFLNYFHFDSKVEVHLSP